MEMTTVTVRLDDLDMDHLNILRDAILNSEWITRTRVSRTDVIRQALRIAAADVIRRQKEKDASDRLLIL